MSGSTVTIPAPSVTIGGLLRDNSGLDRDVGLDHDSGGLERDNVGSDRDNAAGLLG